ncbi:hypothetical protein BCR33DRAFT_721779 [Rhizoclosmatium globosum]|uniref:Uncharacterized protein n=1 Tax=Rhizoclosmatium globosum TaxID=329046 RepID=A0A1Y2BQ41_9FUNG|nr:hypothetical protein BCR33DRAFT_721779 [Rhizoclosmatium globosum]|eukprot:ORY36849.1 hypothetical protein BCR33DRAFT_721779 [Rhizoclosmatium globosum]
MKRRQRQLDSAIASLVRHGNASAAEKAHIVSLNGVDLKRSDADSKLGKLVSAVANLAAQMLDSNIGHVDSVFGSHLDSKVVELKGDGRGVNHAARSSPSSDSEESDSSEEESEDEAPMPAEQFYAEYVPDHIMPIIHLHHHIYSLSYWSCSSINYNYTTIEWSWEVATKLERKHDFCIIFIQWYTSQTGSDGKKRDRESRDLEAIISEYESTSKPNSFTFDNDESAGDQDEKAIHTLAKSFKSLQSSWKNEWIRQRWNFGASKNASIPHLDLHVSCALMGLHSRIQQLVGMGLDPSSDFDVTNVLSSVSRVVALRGGCMLSIVCQKDSAIGNTDSIHGNFSRPIAIVKSLMHLDDGLYVARRILKQVADSSEECDGDGALEQELQDLMDVVETRLAHCGSGNVRHEALLDEWILTTPYVCRFQQEDWKKKVLETPCGKKTRRGVIGTPAKSPFRPPTIRQASNKFIYIPSVDEDDDEDDGEEDESEPEENQVESESSDGSEVEVSEPVPRKKRNGYSLRSKAPTKCSHMPVTNHGSRRRKLEDDENNDGHDEVDYVGETESHSETETETSDNDTPETVTRNKNGYGLRSKAPTKYLFKKTRHLRSRKRKSERNTSDEEEDNETGDTTEMEDDLEESSSSSGEVSSASTPRAALKKIPTTNALKHNPELQRRGSLNSESEPLAQSGSSHSEISSDESLKGLRVASFRTMKPTSRRNLAKADSAKDSSVLPTVSRIDSNRRNIANSNLPVTTANNASDLEDNLSLPSRRIISLEHYTHKQKPLPTHRSSVNATAFYGTKETTTAAKVAGKFTKHKMQESSDSSDLDQQKTKQSITRVREKENRMESVGDCVEEDDVIALPRTNSCVSELRTVKCKDEESEDEDSELENGKRRRRCISASPVRYKRIRRYLGSNKVR